MDNFLILVALLEVLILWQLNLYQIVIFFIVYVWWYLDGKEYTGESRFDGLRKLHFWKHLSPVSVSAPVQNLTNQTRQLYVFHNCSTITPLFWSMGLHGTVADAFFAKNHPIHYMVPPVYMWIPLLREFLKWTGGVTWSKYNTEHTRDTVVTDLLQNGRSIAYSPSDYTGFLKGDIEIGYPDMPSDEVLSYCIQNKVKIIIVNVRHEKDRYAMLKMLSVQNWIYKKIGHFFPVLYWKKHGAKSPLIDVGFDISFDSGNYQNIEILKEALKSHLQEHLFKNK